MTSIILSPCHLLLSSLLIVAQFNGYANAKQLDSNCSKTDTYAIGSTFQSNLNKMLSSLSTEALVNSAFSNQSSGNSPDEVYGLVMCYNDYNTEDCANCLGNITSSTTLPCSTGATATVFYDECLLSYSSKDFLAVADQYEPYCLYSGANSLDVKTLKSLKDALANLSATTPHEPGMFSTKVFSGTENNMSAFMQCTRNLSPDECGMCISYAMDYFNWCSINGTVLGMRIFTRNCYIRYESHILSISSFPRSLVPSPPLLPSPAPPSSVPPPPSPGSKSNSTMTIAISVVVVSLVASIATVGFCLWRRKWSSHEDEDDNYDIISPHENVETELQYILKPNAEYQVYKFSTLQIATTNFSDANKLGKGGFGPVYKGILPGGKEIAVKRLSGSSAQGITEFKNEVEFLAKLKHKNLVQLLGCCMQKMEKLLCYEYLPNGSLDKILFEKDASTKVSLDWKMRHRIIEGITRGLHYLHEESRIKIIHRDLKVSNILLDKDMNPKISDFGLARFFEEDQTQKDTNVIAGTFGYMAPEYILRGNFSAKSDVYSFGILLLEIVTGQKNSSFVGPNRISNLVHYAFKCWKEDKMSDLKDPMLEDEFNEDIKRCTHIALLCVQEDPNDRPSMETVKNMLSSPSMIIPSFGSTLLTWPDVNYARNNSMSMSMTTDTSTLRSQTEGFTTNTLSVGSQSETNSGTTSTPKIN